MAMEPSRLFDLVDYQLTRFHLPDMLAGVEDGKWRHYPTAEVKATALQLAAALHHCGASWQDGTTEGRSKVALISSNRPEWILLDLAVQQAGAVLVPLYPTVHSAELQYILDHAGVSTLFVENKALAQKAAALMPMLPRLKHIYTFDKTDSFRHWTCLLDKPTAADTAAIQKISSNISATDLATIVYTSGTTGTPKGVMLSHQNILSDVKSCHPLVADVGIAGKKVLSFLPLNHAFERCANYLYFYSGASVYYAQSTATIADDLKSVKPVLFTTVPRLLEKVYETILSKGAQLKGWKKQLFDWSVALAERYEINKPLPLGYRAKLALADRLIYSKWREALGGNVKAVITGAAACQVKLLRAFSAAGIVIMEGYGLTEAAPVVSGNRYHAAGRSFGTVGPILDNIEIAFAPDGELLVKGDNVMMGYYRQPEQTREVLKNGWLHTGDIAILEKGKFLKITDRKKELFKTSGGKYVAPQPIENSMVQSRWIEQMMVTGAGEKFVSALIVPAFTAIKEWYAAKGHPYPGNEEAIKEKSIIQIIQKEIQQFNQNFNPVEQVKKFQLLPAEWTIDGGELTHTLKLRRKQILEKYQHLVAQLYA